MASVGRNVPRREGPEKLCGLAKYIDDHDFPGCLHGATFRSSIPSGRIKKVTFDPAFPWSECVVATAADIPGVNRIALHVPYPKDDQPLLAGDRVNHPMEPIALVAHPVRQRAYEALKFIRVEYEPEEPALTIEDSLAKKRLLFSPDNVFKDILISKGDLEAGFAKAHRVVEGEYRVPSQEQAYIENNGVAAYLDGDGTLVITGSMQCPYYVKKGLAPVFPRHELRVIQTTTGGGFGGKEEYPDMIGGHAALLALKARRPVKIIYDRHEDMLATTKRHPGWVRHRTAVGKDGRLLAQDVEFILDGGAYVTLSPVVLSRGAIHAAGPYECPNTRIRARAVATNTPPNGAFRGFGAPQSLFAAELHMEKIAAELGMDPAELRRRNALRPGSSTATSQVLDGSVGTVAVLDAATKRSRYALKRKECDRWNKKASNPTWRGVGLSLVYHGVGFTGSGEAYLASKAGVALTKEGGIEVLAASTEIGQGTNTMFSQIAADALGVPLDWVSVHVPDTAKVPDSGPTVASRTCTIVGRLVERAALSLKEALGKTPQTRAELKDAAKRLCNGNPRREFIAQYEKPAEVEWDDKTYSGAAYGSYGYAATVVELEIDKATYEVRARRVTSAFDLGKAIHPLLAEGQIIGGLTQGLGYALYENPVFKDGAMANATLTNYVIPTAPDTPPMDILLLGEPYRHGPFGAKGLAEMPMDAPAPAVAAAIRHATGRWLCELPILPEKICEAMNDQADGQQEGQDLSRRAFQAAH